jgi:hypothetical protein
LAKIHSEAMMDDGEQQRLARLKDDERRRSARQSAMRRMLSQDDTPLEDKVAAVKTVQREDKTRVVSAISAMLGQDRKS